ncbi:uncharacterized protein mwh isoform X2 [Prorops nasuta]|uniref:uncharacterized protein mwh isoform X2 n=2 Tax=Prorops nasuta TaxID=863751 RepID=UPI0034CD1842
MGNAKSQQPCQQRKPLYLFYLIQRTWCIVVDHKKASQQHQRQDRCCGHTDWGTDLSSKCSSSCRDYDYRQDSLIFDSEGEMAPNAEEELMVLKPWGAQPEKERLRPPTYNAEDYAIALRRWGRRPLGSVQDSQGTLPSTTSSSSGYASGSGEMTLRQFTSVSELLNKLRADLRLAFPSFVQEFASPPADGVTLLLETLRGVQLAQSSPPGSAGQTGLRMGSRRAALDELGCVECLAACAERSPDASRLLVQAQPGLLALAVCLTSSLNRSRVLALQLLTKVCQTPGGHAVVSEAVSTLRLRYGEGGRFRFLAGALLASRAAIALRVAGVSFLNAFLKSAPRSQTRLYIQAEACEAGLEPRVLEEWLREISGHEEDPLTELLHKEVQRWSQNCVDVEMLQRRAARAEDTCRLLSKKISSLQAQLQKLQLEKLNNYNLNDRDRKKSLNGLNAAATVKQTSKNKVSSNAEDEGISSSERSSSPEDRKESSSNSNREKKIENDNGIQDNDQETTIEDVIEELRIIVKDAEEEFDDKNAAGLVIHQAFSNNNNNNSNSSSNREDRRITCSGDPKDCQTQSLDNSQSYLYEKIAKRDAGSRDWNRAHSCSKMSIDLQDNTTAASQQNQSKGEQVTYFGNEDFKLSSAGDSRRRAFSKSSVQDGSVKIMVKGADVEEAIVPAILHPQPPRRSPPSLSTIMAVRNCDLVDPEEAYRDDEIEEEEEETLGDGSDSLLSASRLKYNHPRKSSVIGNNAMFISPNKDTVIDQISSKSLNDLGRFDDSIAAEKSCRISLNREEGKLDNYKSSETLKIYESVRHTNEHTVLRKHSEKYRNGPADAEKRKLLGRSASHDYLLQESSVSSLNSRRSMGGHSSSSSRSSSVDYGIRKFESLKSLDEQRSLQNYNGSPRQWSDNLKDFHEKFIPRHTENDAKSRIRRSESFHHAIRKDKEQCASRTGSDSGLFYITDYNLEPVHINPPKPRSVDPPKSPNLLCTKSLDRIDEGLDSMVDIVITKEKNKWAICSRQRSKSKSSKEEKKLRVSRSKSTRQNLDRSSKDDQMVVPDRLFLKNDHHLYNNISLRNDQLYEDQTNERLWAYENQINSPRKNIDFQISNDTPIILPKSGAANKFLGKSSDTAIFAGRTYDTFGLGKNRFNAGKYSGHQMIKENVVAGRRNTTSAVIGTRGKVTDVISGLY